MPARTRSAADPPTRTPSFVCEVPLRVSRAQERTLLARLEAARQVYNACLGQARRRVRLVRESKAYQHARTLPRDDPGRKARFRQARAQHGCSEYALHAYAQQFGHSWLGEHLDSLTIQTLASRAYRAANRLLVGKARRVRFKGRHQLDTVEGKTKTSGIRWCGTRVEWKGLELEALLDPRDQVQAHGLACPVKYVRLVRRKLGERNRFYAQLVCEGTPYQKPQHQLGSGIVGLDLGPSTIAVVVRAGSIPPAVLSRGGSRHPSAAPPGPAARSAAPGQQPGQLRRAGPDQARSEALEGLQTPAEGAGAAARTPPQAGGHAQAQPRAAGPSGAGAGRAPFTWSSSPIGRGRRPTGSRSSSARRGMFVERLSRLAASAGGTIVLINAWRARLSQTCHCGRIKKKARSQRWQGCPCGASAQRDLFSAYLACFVDPETSLLDAGQAQVAWPGWEPTRAAGVRAGHSKPTREGQASACRLWSASGGPSQSGSLAEGFLTALFRRWAKAGWVKSIAPKT